MAAKRSRLTARGPWPILRLVLPALLSVVVVVVVGSALSDDDVDPRSATASNTDAGSVASEDGSNAAGAGDEGTVPEAGASDATEIDAGEAAAIAAANPDLVPPEELPLEAEVTGTTALADGDLVTIRVTADEGSEIYGFQARLCAGDASIVSDSDIRPTRTGKCVAQPMTPSSDAVIEFLNSPPYDVAEATFRVGVGTSTYTMDDGKTVSVTCDRDHPCLLAVKYQVPYGYGFRTYPLEYR